MLDVVLRNGLVCDGTGAAPVPGEVGIAGDRIVAVGRVPERGVAEIDAAGAVIAPGFIDVHTHYDCQVFWDPAVSPSLWHGVTTVVTGNCGFTVAPCRPEHRRVLMRLLSFVEGMPIEALEAGLPWTWTTFAEYVAALEAAAPALNIAPFVGHSAIRLWVMGAAAMARAADGAESTAMARLVAEALDAGAIGWSTSRSPTHFFADDGAPAPSRLATPEELDALATALGAVGRGLIEIAPASTLGRTADKLAEIPLFHRLAERSGRPVTFAPLFQNDRAPGEAPAVLEAAAAVERAGAPVVAQVGCRPLEIRFDFRTPGFGLENNPAWRPRMALPVEERRRLFASPAFRAELAAGAGGFVANLAPGWERLVLRLPATAATRRWQDRSVAEIAAATGAAPVDAFCDLVLADDLAGQWGALVLNTDEEALAAMMRHPAAQLALSDAGAHGDTLCDQGFTSWLLGHWVRERGRFELGEAVRLVTSLPADRWGLAGRGRLRPGAAADVVVFDPARIGVAPTERVHDLPEGCARLVQRARGIAWVLVRGVPVVAAGEWTGARPGRVLRGGRG